MITIENETLRVTINEVGALLTSVYLKKKNIEALWQADDKNSWPSQDVVMFPFIGVAKYSLDGVLHEGGRQHGFARDSRFTVVEKAKDKVVLSYHDDKTSFALYPYRFELRVTYSLSANKLHSHFEVTNRSERTMPFMLGNHPGYRYSFFKGSVDLGPNQLSYLPVRENLSRKEEPFPYDGEISLTKDFFRHYETLVFVKGPAPKVNTGLGYSIVYHFVADYCVLWSHPEKGDFLCVEPWWGVNQYEGKPLDLAKRKNITLLPKGKSKAFDNEVEFVY